MKHKKDLAIGLDIGGTKVLAALISNTGEIVSKKQCATVKGQAFSDSIIHLIADLLQEKMIDRDCIKGIGIATAGVIDSEKKEILFANNLALSNLPIGEILEKHFSLPVHLYNDANAAAVGEWKWGSGKGKENVIYITVSTGIGAGIIVNGRLVTGVNDSAGEFGHTSIDYKGIPCECGNKGCLEKYASGTAITRLATERLNKSISAIEIYEAAKLGDSFSIRLLEEIGVYLGVGITNLIHLFNTEAVILGGGVMNASDYILPSICKTIKECAIHEMVKNIKILKSKLGLNASVIGSVGLLFDECHSESLIVKG